MFINIPSAKRLVFNSTKLLTLPAQRFGEERDVLEAIRLIDMKFDSEIPGPQKDKS